MLTRQALLVPTAALFAIVAAGCASRVDPVDPSVASEMCGGAVCFVAGQAHVARWGDGQVEIVALPVEQSPCVAVQREGVLGDGDPPSVPAAIIATSIDAMIRGAEPGAIVPVVSRDEAGLRGGPLVTIRARRVDPTDGYAVADEEGVDGSALVVDIDENTGTIVVQIVARWSSGVSRTLTLDVEGPPVCG